MDNNAYKDFITRFRVLIDKQPELITATLSNIFTMRLIGNKTHGDLAEVAIAEFINQYMYDFRSVHVGKDLFRSKTSEEDIKIISEITNAEFSVSLKAYGKGPLQLSTDKKFRMFPRLEREGDEIEGKDRIHQILSTPAFAEFRTINVLPLIYNEKEKICNILVFDYERAEQEIYRISKIVPNNRRIHPVYRFYNKKGEYICEVRYGGATSNALQRGLWSHTENGINYFNSLTNGWIDYSHNKILVQLFAHALVCSTQGHSLALDQIKSDIIRLKQQQGKRT